MSMDGKEGPSDAVTLQRSGDTIRAVFGESAPGVGDGGSVSFADNPSLYMTLEPKAGEAKRSPAIGVDPTVPGLPIWVA